MLYKAEGSLANNFCTHSHHPQIQYTYITNASTFLTSPVSSLTPHHRASTVTCVLCKVNLIGGNEDLERHLLDQHIQIYPTHIDGNPVSISRLSSSQGLRCPFCEFDTPSFFGIVAHFSRFHNKHTNWYESEIRAANEHDIRKERKRTHLASTTVQDSEIHKRARLSSCMPCIEHGVQLLMRLCFR